MPAARQRSRSPSTAAAVIAITGSRVPAARSARIARVAAYPSIRGIWTSIRTASNASVAQDLQRGDLPSSAVVGGVAERLEQADGHQLVDRVVLDDQDPVGPARPRRSAGASAAGRGSTPARWRSSALRRSPDSTGLVRHSAMPAAASSLGAAAPSPRSA